MQQVKFAWDRMQARLARTDEREGFYFRNSIY